MNIFNYLTIEELKETKTIEFKKDSIIFYEDEICNQLCFVVSGELEISSYLYNGEKVVYNTLKSGEMFGGNLIFSTFPHYKGNVKGINDGRIILIQKNEVINLLQNNKKFLLAFLREENDFTKALNSKIKLLSIDSAKDRLLLLLEENRGKLKIKNVTCLAENLSLSREATSRLLSKLKRDNIITFQNKTISLN